MQGVLPQVGGGEAVRWAKQHDACRGCSGTQVKHAARGLCRTCHSRHNVAGTLGQFDLAPPPMTRAHMRDADFRYMKWLGAKQPKSVGRAEWSKVGEWCGDGSRLSDGCGSWQHDHYRGGLCCECYWIVAGLDLEPRDVRMSRGLMTDVATVSGQGSRAA